MGCCCTAGPVVFDPPSGCRPMQSLVPAERENSGHWEGWATWRTRPRRCSQCGKRASGPAGARAFFLGGFFVSNVSETLSVAGRAGDRRRRKRNGGLAFFFVACGQPSNCKRTIGTARHPAKKRVHTSQQGQAGCVQVSPSPLGDRGTSRPTAHQ